MLSPRLSAPPRGDVALAVGLTALGEVDVIAPGLFSTHLTGPRWSGAVAVAVAGLALAWRRTAPFAVFLVVFGVLAVQALVFGAAEGNGSLLPALVASYSVAAYGSRSTAYIALALIPLVLALRETHNSSNTDWPASARPWRGTSRLSGRGSSGRGSGRAGCTNSPWSRRPRRPNESESRALMQRLPRSARGWPANCMTRSRTASP